MRWLFRIAFILIAVVMLVVGALLLMPGDKLGEILSDQARAQTGRDLTLSGDVRLSFWPVLGVETGPVTFGNADWAGPEPMLTASGLSVGVDAAALLSGNVKIKQIIARDPVLRLEKTGDKANWEIGPAPAAATSAPAATDGESPSTGAPAAAREVTLDTLEMTNARVIYAEDGRTTFDFGNLDIAASWPAVDAPLSVQARLKIGEGPVDVDMEIQDLPGFAEGDVTTMDLELTAPGGSITYSGKVNVAGEMSGLSRIKATDSARMFAALGQPGVSVPKGLGQVADISTQMTYTQDGRLALRDLVAVLDSNRFEGEADIVVADPPQVTARLVTGDLDLSQAGAASQPKAGGSGAGSGGATPVPQGWSRAPIDASVLSVANGTIRLDANSIAVPDLKLGQSSVTLTLDRSRAVLEMHPVRLFSGALTGQVVANNRNGLSVGGDLKADGIELQQALSTFGGIERLSGRASGQVKFLGVGQSEDQIMRSLKGEGRVDMGRGVISGFDLDRLMGTGEGTGGTTVFNSLTASFTMSNGDLFNRDLLMQLDNFRADGDGRIGLGKRDIDYLFTPVALRANAGEGLAVPVRIVGPWDDPRIKPDLSQVIEAAREKKLNEVEARAKEKLRQKVEEELDTTITEDQNIEDVIKDKLEEEATKGLLKLLGVD
ncbi:membrane assembly protein AsmA [Ruegeria marisrubri]|uniref:Membrane assembly protein AsmA n=1 Tax=Ruegeria marisrubri TaxID=1685379 RepID=A0A0X3TCH7_9RHOB|nr:AsmA family protein [Ruegeria marisrubri]KUJ73329.1 membrane assembly protein AsmA [Ruegeria marisrubri]